MIAERIHRQEYHISKEVPSLIDIATNVIASNFSLYPHLNGLENQYIIDKIIEKVPTDLPITITAPYIINESYWKSCSQKRWKNIRPPAHGMFWKHAYLENYVQELVSKFPAEADQHPLLEQIIAACPYIFTLNIPQLPSHLDLRLVFKTVPTLCRLSVTYGAKHLGADYDRTLFGMTMEDAASLAKCIKNSQSLIYLSLPGNQIDDEFIRMLARGLMINRTLIELDLSHNRIGDHGARRISRYLFHNEVLQILDLTDNQIQYDGSRYLGQALRHNESLRELSLKHNRLDDKAGAKLCNDLFHNSTIEKLNLSANQLSSLFCDKLSELIRDHKSLALQDLDISCNFLIDPEAEDLISEEMIQAVEQLRDTLYQKCPLYKIDIRNNSIPKRTEKEITEIVLKRELDSRNIPLYKTKTPVSSAASRVESRGSSHASAAAGENVEPSPRSPQQQQKW